MADETKELTLLKNVENRIVFAQNDTALQVSILTGRFVRCQMIVTEA